MHHASTSGRVDLLRRAPASRETNSRRKRASPSSNFSLAAEVSCVRLIPLAFHPPACHTAAGELFERLNTIGLRCSKPAVAQLIYRYNTTKSEIIATINRGADVASRSKQSAGEVTVPRRTAQHTVLRLSIVPIFAPLPYVASHVVQTTKIRLKASHRTSPWIAVVIAFND